MPQDLPDFEQGQPLRKMSARQMRNLSDAALQARNSRFGSGLNTRHSRHGNTTSLSNKPTLRELTRIRFVAIVVEPQEDDVTLTVRQVAYKENDATKPDDVKYRWATDHRITAVPGYGFTAMDFAGFEHPDIVTDEDGKVIGEILPDGDTTYFELHPRDRRMPLVAMGNTGGEFGFAVMRALPTGPDGVDLNLFWVKVQQVRLNAGKWVAPRPAQVIATYPGIPARYYEPFLWVGEITGDTPLLRTFNAAGETWLEQSVRWPLRKSRGGIDLSDCTPVEVIT